MSGYRQFKLFDEFGVKNSQNLRNQKLRLESYLASYRKASRLRLDIIVLENTNIDTNPEVDYNINYNHKSLFEMWSDCLLDLKWTIHNSEYTRYAPHQKPSINDHISSKCEAKLSQVKTIRNIISDHCYLTVDYDSKGNLGLDGPKTFKPYQTKA